MKKRFYYAVNRKEDKFFTLYNIFDTEAKTKTLTSEIPESFKHTMHYFYVELIQPTKAKFQGFYNFNIIDRDTMYKTIDKATD